MQTTKQYKVFFLPINERCSDPVHISLTNQEAETFLNTKLPANNTHSKKSTGQTIFDKLIQKQINLIVTTLTKV